MAASSTIHEDDTMPMSRPTQAHRRSEILRNLRYAHARLIAMRDQIQALIAEKPDGSISLDDRKRTLDTERRIRVALTVLADDEAAR